MDMVYFLNKKCILNERGDKKTIIRLNYLIPLILLIIDGAVMFLSISFGARLFFAIFHIYEIVMYLNLIIFPISICLNFYLIYKLFLKKSEKMEWLLIIKLLIYPFGIWSLPEPSNPLDSTESW